MYTNFKEEEIPDCIELSEFAGVIQKVINTTQPVKILGNLIDKKTGKYIGQEYFKDIEKNTTAGYAKKYNDFSGLYVFYNKDIPVYVGISNSIIRRLRFNFIPNNNAQSRLVYLIAESMYKKESKKKYVGLRNDFPFEKYRKDILKEIVNRWKVNVIKIENGYKLTYSEIFIASTLKSYWNCFTPH